jgi:hypothetical protein
MKKLPYSLVTITFIFLTACGGGGGGSNSGGGSGGGSPVTTSDIALSEVVISPADVLATTSYQSNVAYTTFEHIKKYLGRFESLIFTNAYAVTGCGILCSPSYPPVNMGTTQQITQKIVSGNLVKLDVKFSKINSSDSVSCDFTNAGILVNSIWLTNLNTNDSIASLTIPSKVDSTCKLTYTTADYFISGSTNTAYALDTQLTPNITDVIPAGDPAFNTSTNPLIISSGQVSEISISNGVVTQTQLTTPSVTLGTYMGAMAYNGAYLVGVSTSAENPIIVFQKGSTSFQVFRTTTSNGYGSVFINSDGNFVWNNVYLMKVFNPVTLATTPYTPSSQPSAMFGANGRYLSWIMSDRCMIWDTSNGNWVNLYLYPTYATVDPWGLYGVSQTISYSRISRNYAYCVDGTARGYTRYNLTTGVGVGINLDNSNLVASSYQIFSDVAYATTTNTSNSDVLYVKIDLATGTVSNLGIISSGTRKVVNLKKVNGAS